jgi:hypothetical protein
MPKMPSVPSDNRSPKGTGADPHVEKDQQVPDRKNYNQQGRQGNTFQNTHHQGHQQDR